MIAEKTAITDIKKQKQLTEGKILPRLILFNLPILFSNALQQLYNLFDGLIVGRFVSGDALTSVIESGKVVQVLVSFFVGISAGAGVVVAQYFGARNKENTSKSVHTAMTLSLIFGAVLMVAGILLTKVLLKAIDVPADYLSDMETYIRIYFYSIIFVMVYNMGAGVLRAMGDSLTPLIFLIITTVLDIALNVVFVHPKILNMGVAGAAWTTLISQGLSALLVVVRLSFFSPCPLRVKKLGVSGKMLKKIIVIGLPMGLQNSIISAAHIILLKFINGFDNYTINGINAYSKIDGFVALPLNSFALAITTFVGQNVGAGKYERAKKGGRIGMIACQIMPVFSGVVIFFTCRPLLSLMGIEGAAAEYGLRFMRILVISYPILVVCHIYTGILRGLGKSLIPSISMVACMCFLRVIFLYTFMPIYQSIDIVLLSYPITWIACAIILLIYYYKKNWLKQYRLKHVKLKDSDSQLDGDLII